jgi:HAMP domain-containing protein
MTDREKALEAALLPCPFCGGDADLDYYHNENSDGGGRGKVVCVECGADQCGEDFGWMTDAADKAASKAQAVAAWNTRADTAEVLRLRDELASGSFYKESDIDAMQDEIARLREALLALVDEYADPALESEGPAYRAARAALRAKLGEGDG